ncbi:TPA: TonB-dependent hemoglobin/transferrin/lactoferrin family receptor [Neisseria weaveri]|uniref:TonB-dependent hemoglobin/transferrin/lactoferrin family receptor n=1 Tax=Neisseria weaveri TaxID=28091 RepID=UPI0007C9C037|nr:TonB-dependent hemoglobin/transferrin/lactoferrin family receptor [Neisseria weaveri]SAY50585.1 hemoglobin-haptoglobin-utilization protein [Neisseria weaveri]
MSFPFKPAFLALMVAQVYPLAVYAETAPQNSSTPEAANTTTLEAVKVRGQRRVQNLGEERVRRKALDERMVQDEHDLVRYDPGVTVVEGGRAGSNGFAIRGVDKDRVAINVDGLAQAESRSSEAFQELFGAYGNFNANRNAAEIEHISEVTITKGADSLKSGSGALGGAINYKTKSPSDYLNDEKNYFLGLKTGYVGRNNQRFSSMTAAGRFKGFEALGVYTRRKGDETKNNAKSLVYEVKDTNKVYNPADPSISMTDIHYPDRIKSYGKLRSLPDPQRWNAESVLLKGGYRFGFSDKDENYFGAVFEESRNDRKTEELSNLFASDFSGNASADTRNRQDVSYRKRVGFEFENRINDVAWWPWDEIKFRWDKQDILMNTWTWDLPTNYALKGINSEVYHSFRQLKQYSQQSRIDAEKTIEFDSFPLAWAMQYGLGWGKGSNENDDQTYFARLYNKNIMTSSSGQRTFLTESESKNRNLYWNHIFRFGGQQQYKLNLGWRHDRVQSKALDNPTYPQSLKLLVPGLGNGTTHKGNSYSLGFDWRFHPNFNFLAKYSSGFRAPTSDENWLLFPHPDFYLLASPKLKHETAKNYELGIAGGGKAGEFRLSGFKTKYRDFIELAYLGPSNLTTRIAMLSNGDKLLGAPVWQNVNRASANVNGIEFQGKWNLDSIGLSKGMHTGLVASYIKGKSKHENGKNYPINALAPWSATWSLGYDAPSKRWGLTTFVTHTARKKPEDTIRSSDERDEPFPFARHSGNYTLWDMAGYYNFGKHVTLRAGVYNITNREYYSWDSLRSIREFGTVNRVDNCNVGNGPQHATCAHAGITRFSAPGRTFNVTLEARF